MMRAPSVESREATDDGSPRGPMAIPAADAKRASIVQRCDGMWSIGIADDAPGPFETREFAEAVARGRRRSVA